jgi:CubicO group peptidase (beta-lactamase class C family)
MFHGATLRRLIAGSVLGACSSAAPSGQTTASDGGSLAEGSDDATSAPSDGGADTEASTPGSPCQGDKSTFDTLVTRVEAGLHASGVSGASIAIVCNGTVYSAGMGQTATTSGSPVTEHTRFNVGSTQKAFTAALALRLAEKGTIALSDPASKWVTQTNTSAPYGRSFTIAELLSHVSGYPAYPIDAAQSLDLAGFFTQMGQVQLWSPPGVVFDYNNLGFELAGLAMQNATGQPFASLVESEVFPNAGMTDARMDPAKVTSEGDYAVGYPSDNSGPVHPNDLAGTVFGPDTGAWASADDLAHFANTLMDGGGGLLQAASLALMTTPHVTSDDPSQEYGYGMFVTDYGGTPMWSHPGDNSGYEADLTIFPTLGFASALLMNSDGAGPPTAYLGAVETFTGKKLPPPPGDAFDAADEAEHVGTYQSAGAGTITVAQSAGAMKVTVGGTTATLTPLWKDAYSFPYAPWGGGALEINFARASGKVAYAVTRAFVGAKQ